MNYSWKHGHTKGIITKQFLITFPPLQMNLKKQKTARAVCFSGGFAKTTPKSRLSVAVTPLLFLQG